MSEFLTRHGSTVTLGALIVALGIFMWSVTSNLYSATRADVGEVKTEVAGLRSDLRNEVSGLRSEVGGLRSELHADVGAMRTEIVGLREDLREDAGAMRMEIGGLRKDFGEWRTEIAAQMSTARQQTATRIFLVDSSSEFARALIDAVRQGGTISTGSKPEEPGDLRVPASSQ